MNHIIKRKIDEKELEHAKSRGEIIQKMDEIVGVFNVQSESQEFDEDLIMFEFGNLISKIVHSKKVLAQKNILEALTIYED